MKVFLVKLYMLRFRLSCTRQNLTGILFDSTNKLDELEQLVNRLKDAATRTVVPGMPG